VIHYGDRERSLVAGPALMELALRCTKAADVPDPLDRRSRCATILIEAGEIAQGVIDADFRRRGFDEWGPVEAESSALLLACARLFSGGRKEEAAQAATAARALASLAPPAPVQAKLGEGFAYYALYPDAYLEAARRFRERLGGPVVVLGLRSIGAPLAALVAAGAGERISPVITLRPVGHPFARTLALGPGIERMILRGLADATYAVVDEGPGLSGSSFGAVADWLEGHGVAPERIHFFPSHLNALGPSASEPHRRRWEGARKWHVPFCELDLPFPWQGCHEDISSGRWREKLFADRRDWPPAFPHQERSKVLYPEPAGGTWVRAKFSGLGRSGEAKLERARTLAELCLTPPVRQLVYGFLVEDWLADARPYRSGDTAARPAVAAAAVRYLSALASGSPARPDETGASPEDLLRMASHNAREELGPWAEERLRRWEARLSSFHRILRPVMTDNRMMAWEWLVLPDGHVLKTDALDHSSAHDCVGAQDIAWDVAGAAVELGLTSAELASVGADPGLVDFMTDCYLAFQLGACATAASWADAEETARLAAARSRYASLLRQRLSSRRKDRAPVGPGE
jgi:hypothetical protein